MKKNLCIVFFLYFLALLQASFFVHMFPSGMVPNFVAVAVVGLSIFEHSKSNVGMFAALFGGLFLDMFSSRPFGFWVILLLAISFALKTMLEYYVRPPILKKIQ